MNLEPGGRVAQMVLGTVSAIGSLMGTSFRGPEAAPTFLFLRNQKVGAASGPRMRGKNHFGTWNLEPGTCSVR